MIVKKTINELNIGDIIFDGEDSLYIVTKNIEDKKSYIFLCTIDDVGIDPDGVLDIVSDLNENLF